MAFQLPGAGHGTEPIDVLAEMASVDKRCQEEGALRRKAKVQAGTSILGVEFGCGFWPAVASMMRRVKVTRWVSTQ